MKRISTKLFDRKGFADEDPSKSCFVWTEAIGCGEILIPMLSSYLIHHKEAIHVIGLQSDLANLPVTDQIIPIDLSVLENVLKITENQITEAYKSGHQGTALLWAAIITRRGEDNLIHLDADNIFVGEVISEIVEKLGAGYSVVGSRRPYRFRQSPSKFRHKVLNHLRRDTVNTHCFGFNRKLIKLCSDDLQSLIEGKREKYSFNIQRSIPVIDFFDRMTFYLARKGKGVFYLDSDNQSRHGHHTRYGTMESRLISFAAVGSGSAFYKNPDVKTSDSYKDFALSSYSLFAKYLLDRDVDYPMLESPYLVDLLSRLDKSTWTLRKADGE